MNKTLKNILYFSLAIVFVKFVGTFRTFIVAKLLQPSDYGVWITILMVYYFGPITSLGSVETLLKEVPYLKGKGDLTGARTIERGVLSVISISAIMVLVIGSALLILSGGSILGLDRGIISLITLTVSLSLFSAFLYHRFAANHSFEHVSILESFRAISGFFNIIAFGYFMGLPGAILGLFINEILVFTLALTMSLRVLGKLGFDFRFTLMKKIIAIGLPITVVWWMFMIQTSADRLVSIAMLGKTATGYYGLGGNIYAAILIIPLVIGRVLYPRLNEDMGKNDDMQYINDLVIGPTKIFSLTIPVIMCAVYAILPFVFYTLLPQYSLGMPSAFILLFGVFFVGIRNTGTNYLISSDDHKTLLVFLALSLILNVSGNVILVRLGYGIGGIALSTAVSSIFLTTLIWFRVYWRIGFSIRGIFPELAFLYLPFLVFLVYCLVFFTRVRNLTAIGYDTSAIFFMTFTLVYALTIIVVKPLRETMIGILQQAVDNLGKKTKQTPIIIKKSSD